MQPLRDQDILVLADDVWRAPKRTRHKIPQAWARAGNRVLWIETPYPSDRRRLGHADVEAIEPGLFVASPAADMRTNYARRKPWRAARAPLARAGYVATIRRALARLGMRPAWTVIWQEPRLAFALDALNSSGRVYYASDRFVDVSGRGHEEPLLRGCLDRVNVAFATSEKIAADLRAFHPEVHVIPHAVDLDWWQQADRSEPADLASIPHPRLLFMGVGTVKFDLELWREVASRRPDWQLVTVGPFHEAMMRDPKYRELEHRPNVHFLGEHPYEALPAYLEHADVLTCPYRVDAVRTASGLPHKFYEYALSGHPILSTPFTELEATLPQLTVVPARAWSDLTLDDLPRLELRSKGVAGQTYADRVDLQRRLLARLPAEGAHPS